MYYILGEHMVYVLCCLYLLKLGIVLIVMEKQFMGTIVMHYLPARAQ